MLLAEGGLGHMTLDAGGKGTFLRHESSTVQSAARCNVDHPDIAPSPHLCDTVPAFLRIWMPKDSFPPTSSVMWPSPQRASPSRTKPSGRGRIASPRCSRTACVTSGGARLAYGDTWIKPSPWPLSAACSRPTGTRCARCRRPHRHDQTHTIASSRSPQRDGAPNPDTS